MKDALSREVLSATSSSETKFQARIGGMSCSFCVGTIKKACQRQRGVRSVNVSLSCEEVLVRYNPSQATRAAVMKTLTDLGYTIHDPEKVKALEEQKRELRQAKTYLLIAAGFTLVSFIFMGVTWTGTVRWWFRWPMMGLALATMFGLGLHIKKKAWQSLRRGILNQHTLLGFGAFAGLTGGRIPRIFHSYISYS